MKSASELATADGLALLDNGRVQVRASRLPLLRSNALDTFEAIMACRNGDVIRSVPGRSTVKLKLQRPEGGFQTVFLKRYEQEYLSFRHKLLRRVRWPGADDEALREWRKILRLHRHGFGTASPVAVGHRAIGGLVSRSFLMTEEIPGGIAADRYILEHLRKGRLQRKWQWLGELGRFARRFQDAQFIHKDFYLPHVFVTETGSGWRFHIIDLQRVVGPHWHLPRWYLKDLVSLAFSLQAKGRCSRTDLLRTYQAYSGNKPLGPDDKRKITKLWRRTQRLARRRPKYGQIWNQQKLPVGD